MIKLFLCVLVSFVLYREIPHFKRWYQLEKVIDSHLTFPPIGIVLMKSKKLYSENIN